MAKVFLPPRGFEPPPFDPNDSWEERDRKEEKYLERLNWKLRAANIENKSGLVGKIVRFQIADGYAQYMVANTKPLQLVYLALGDGYQIPDAHMRGLTVKDIRGMVERDERFAELVAVRE